MELFEFHGIFPYGDYLFRWVQLYNVDNKARIKPPKERKGKPMKKLIALLLALVMMFSLVLTGCGNAAPDPTEPPKADEQAQQPADEKEENDEPVVLKVWVQDNTRVADFNNNKMTTWLEEQGNFDLQITSIPSEDFVTKVNLALTVGAVEDLPDVILANTSKAMPSTSILEWSETGNILPLTEYYNDAELAKNINEAKERTGVDYTSQLRMADGEIYTVGFYNQSYGNEYPAKTFIYKPWLDELGMDMPKTTEDFYNILKAVSETDLNGNGKNDEIPFVGATQSANYAKYLQFLLNAFVYAGDKEDVYKHVENGVVSSVVTTEEFKEGLKYVRQLFQEGLILNESLTMIEDQYKALMNTDEHTVFAITYTTPSTFNNGDISSEFIAIEPLAGPEGVQYATYWQSAVEHRMVITANCKNPEAAFKLGDLMSSEYIGITQRWGEQGKDWDYAAEAKDAQNWEAPYENFDLYIIAYDDNGFWRGTEPTDACWIQAGVAVRQYAIANGVGVPAGSVSSYTQHVNESNSLYQKGGYAPAEFIPVLNYSEDEAVVVGETQSALKSYIAEYIGAVMMGTKNLEGDWDTFQAELEKIGLSDYLAAVQSAYDRMYK